MNKLLIIRHCGKELGLEEEQIQVLFDHLKRLLEGEDMPVFVLSLKDADEPEDTEEPEESPDADNDIFGKPWEPPDIPHSDR